MTAVRVARVERRIVMFGIFLAGSGRIELRDPELRTRIPPR
jgi:hypothetical protein